MRPPTEPGSAANRVYATLTVEVWWEEEDPPLTQQEVEKLAHSTSDWGDWNLLAVSPIRRDSRV